jgi:hypothetical protein
MRKLIPYQQEKLAKEMAKDYAAEKRRKKKIEITDPDPKEVKEALFKKSVNNDAKKQEASMKKYFVFVGIILMVVIVTWFITYKSMEDVINSAKKAAATAPVSTTKTAEDNATAIPLHLKLILKNKRQNEVKVAYKSTDNPCAHIFLKHKEKCTINYLSTDGGEYASFTVDGRQEKVYYNEFVVSGNGVGTHTFFID